jgi:hypothetical protein
MDRPYVTYFSLRYVWSLMPVLSLRVYALQRLAVRKWQIRKISDLNNLSDCGPSSNVALYGPFLKYGTLRICHLQTPIFFVICGLFVVCDLRTQFFFADLKLPQIRKYMLFTLQVKHK